MTDIFIRQIALPRKIEGVTVPNSDDTYDIYINSALTEKKRKAALAHELRHIAKNHLYDYNPVWVNEAEANAEQAAPDAPAHITIGSDIRFAVFDGDKDLTAAKLEEVRAFAARIEALERKS